MKALMSDFEVQFPTEIDIVMTRTFKVPRDLLFRLWSEAGHVKHWWGPEGFITQQVEIDFQVGGRFFVSMAAPDGTLYPCEGIYRDIVHNERIVYEGHALIDNPCGAGLPPQATVTVTFGDERHKDGSLHTRLTLHTRLLAPERTQAAIRGGYVIGWQGALNRLETTITN